MLPPEFTHISQDIRARMHTLMVADVNGTMIPDLLSAEELILAFVQNLGRELMQDYVDACSEQVLANRPPCNCGRPMEILKRRSWIRETLLGPIVVSDPYLYCRRCHENEAPARARLGTGREPWSLPTQEAAVDLASDESCGKAVAKLARHHPGVDMGRTTALELLHHHGAEAREFIDKKLAAAHAQAEAGVVPESSAAALEVEFDASMIPVATMEPIEVAPGEEPKRTPVRGLPVRRKNARWEEVKAGLVQNPGEKERLYTLRPTSDLNECFDDLLSLASLMGWNPETQVRGIADGAIHIRPHMEKVFSQGNFRFILDRPHCKEHLGEAGTMLEPSTGVPAQDWARDALKLMETGRAADVVAELRSAHEASGVDQSSRNDGLRLAANYFERNEDAVAYADYRQQGWSTASSEIESGHRHTVQARMKISGAWWHPDGVDDILALRMLKANGWWDEYWTWKRHEWRVNAQQMSSTLPRTQS